MDNYWQEPVAQLDAPYCNLTFVGKRTQRKKINQKDEKKELEIQQNRLKRTKEKRGKEKNENPRKKKAIGKRETREILKWEPATWL